VKSILVRYRVISQIKFLSIKIKKKLTLKNIIFICKTTFKSFYSSYNVLSKKNIYNINYNTNSNIYNINNNIFNINNNTKLV
jgi:hypothetical protein